MRLARVGAPGAERPVVVAPDGSLLDLRPLTPDVDGAFLARGVAEVAEAVAAGRLPRLPGGPHRFGPPVARPGTLVGIGLNYACYAAATGAQPPTRPVVFLKAATSLSGAHDAVVLLPGSTTTDYEVELAVVVGRTLRHETDPARALAAVAGYAAANDVSDRAEQLGRGGPWAAGKSADTFCPLGPWLVTPDEVDPSALRLSLSVNGSRRQEGSTGDLLFGVGELLCEVSSVLTLGPGDVVLTGTPAGVALGRPEPRPYLRDGDVVELTVEGLGSQRTPVRATERRAVAS